MSTVHDGGRIRRGGRRGSEEEEEDDDEVVLRRPDSPKRWWRLCFGVMMGNEGSRRGSVARLESYYSSSSSPQLGCIIHPDDWRYVLWTHFILLWAVYSSFFTPLEFGFFRGLPENLFLLDIAGQFAFLIDIVIHFSVAYKDSRSHKMVYDRSQIALRYLKSRFSVDLLGCLPWDAIFKACGRKEPVRYMLWIRLSRALRVTEFFEKLEKDIRINYLLTRILKLIVVELYCTHTAACIFYYLATTMPRSKERYTWIGSLKMGDYSYSNFRDIDLWTRYITSLYFAIVTMVTVGYGDIHAVNVREMIFIMIYVSFDMILGAYLLGNMTALIVKGSKTEKYRDKMSELIRYMNRNNLGKQIINEVKNHLRLQYSHQDTEVTALQDIPNSMRTKIQQKLYEPDITKVSLFKGCSPGFIKQIAVRVHEELFLPREVIIEQETVVDQLFILCHGTLEGIRKEDDKEVLVQMDSPSYSTLGTIQLLCNTTFPYTVRASELCKILRLSKQSFTEILEIHFSDGRIILKNLREGNDPSVSEKQLLESDVTLYIMKHESELATRLNCAACDGDLHRLKLLVAAGADPGLTDYNKKSPLHVAASRGHQEIVSFLIEQRVCIDSPDESGNTPLLEAIKHGHDQIVPLLVKAGASLMIDDAGGFLCTTVARKDTDLLKRTLDNGINPNAKNYDSRTPLHVAASEGSYSVANLLLKAGASVLAKDRWGSTPLDESRLSGDKNLIKLLEDAQTLQISEVADSCHLQARLQKRKCTVFPSHPWDARDERGRQGIILWVPRTLQELIEEAKQRLGVEADSCILAENGGKVTDVDMISDGQNLYLMSSGAR